MSKFYEALIKREQYFRCPVVVGNGISHEDAESALDNFWGLESHVENNCDYGEETTVELIRLTDSDSKYALTKVDETDFQGFSSLQGLVVYKTRKGSNEIAIGATYEKNLHGHLIKDENTKTSA
jgi:hypothetical protein